MPPQREKEIDSIVDSLTKELIGKFKGKFGYFYDLVHKEKGLSYSMTTAVEIQDRLENALGSYLVELPIKEAIVTILKQEMGELGKDIIFTPELRSEINGIMKEEIKIAIEGYNDEKLAIQRFLSTMDGQNKYISPTMNCKNRLEEIDKAIETFRIVTK